MYKNALRQHEKIEPDKIYDRDPQQTNEYIYHCVDAAMNRKKNASRKIAMQKENVRVRPCEHFHNKSDKTHQPTTEAYFFLHKC